MGISLENRIEGLKGSPEYKLKNKSKQVIFLLLNLTVFFLYFISVIIAFLFSSKAFPWILLSVFIAVLYNSNSISPQNRPPLDSIFHLTGSLSFSIAGGVWNGISIVNVFPFGLVFSLWFTGGYWNHLLLDKEKDFSAGRRTLAHRIKPEFLRFGAVFFMGTGDLLMVIFLKKESFLFSILFLFVFLLIIISGLKIADPRIFRKIYRLIHFIAGIVLFFYFLNIL